MGSTGKRRSWPRILGRQSVDALLGVLTAATFLLLEGVLILVGVQVEDRWANHLRAGFDPDVPYLAPDPNLLGGYRTRCMGRSPEVSIPAKRELPRVILFGGSNTAMMHKRHFARALSRRFERPFEVINLGRSGYGSARVAILFRQVLELLDPDAVVIYCGHNEFVERGFEMDLERAAAGYSLRRFAEWFRSTRTARACLGDSASRSATSSGRIDDPDAWRQEYGKFRGLTYDQTQLFWNAYERNLKAMCEWAEEREVPVLLSTVIYNRLSAPRVSTPPEDLSPEELEEIDRHHQRAAERYPPPFAALLPESEADRLHGNDWGKPGLVDPSHPESEPLPGRRPFQGELAGHDPQFPVQRPWKPAVREWYRTLEWLLERPREDECARLREARSELEGALSIWPTHPRVLYEHALCSFALGERGPETARRFEDAARFDRAPRNGNEATNNCVRRVAEAHPEVLFVDADRHYAALCPDRLVGWESMLDHCHITRGAREVVLELFAQRMVEAWTF